MTLCFTNEMRGIAGSYRANQSVEFGGIRPYRSLRTQKDVEQATSISC